MTIYGEAPPPSSSSSTGRLISVGTEAARGSFFGRLNLGVVALLYDCSIAKPLTNITVRKVTRCFAEEIHVFVLVITINVRSLVVVCALFLFLLSDETTETFFTVRLCKRP